MYNLKATHALLVIRVPYLGTSSCYYEKWMTLRLLESAISILPSKNMLLKPYVY